MEILKCHFKKISAIDDALLQQASINEERSQLITSFMEKTVCSGLNLALGFSKGVLSFAENLLKFGAILNVGYMSLSTAMFDVYKGLLTGKWDFSATKGLWTKAVSLLSIDYTGKISDSFYNTEFGKKINDNSWGLAKKDGLLYSVSEGVGYYSGTVALATLTGGGSLAQGFFMGAATFGKESTKQFSKSLKNAENEGREISSGEILKALGLSTTKAVIEGSVVGSSDLIKSTFKNKKVLAKVVPIAVKSLKPITSEFASSEIEGRNINWKKVGVDTAATIVAETFSLGIKSVKLPSSASKPNIKSEDIALKVENAPNGEFGSENEFLKQANNIKSEDIVLKVENTPNSEFEFDNESNTVEYLKQMEDIIEKVLKKAKDKFIKDTAKSITKEVLTDE